MSSFSAGWLALREPADVRARSRRLGEAVGARLPRDRPVHVLDLGAGTGSNLRFLSSILPVPQEWRLADNDSGLLAHAANSPTSHVTTHAADIANVDAIADLVDGSDLVTASALLDLVSERWLALLVDRCRAAGALVLFALSYDGHLDCTPDDPDDRLVASLVNAHQRTDKGFGPALGPDAAERSVVLLREHGYGVEQEKSDWDLADDERELQRQLIEGWATAAREIGGDANAITGWRDRRFAYLADGRSRLRVGHVDVAAWPR